MIASQMEPGAFYRATRKMGKGRYYTMPRKSTQAIYKELQRRERKGTLKALLMCEMLAVRDKGWVFVWSHYRYKHENGTEHSRSIRAIDPEQRVRKILRKPAPHNCKQEADA